MSLLSKCILKLKKYPENYFDVEAMSDVDNIYIVSKDGKYGLLDITTRKLIMQLQDNEITSYSEDLVGMTKGGKAGYVDLKGKVFVDFKYDKAEAFHNHLARVTNDDMMGYIDRSNNVVIPVKYDLVTTYIDGYAKIFHRGKWGYVNEAGKIVGGIEFDCLGDITEGMIPVQKGSKWGYITLYGGEVIPFKYSKAGSFFDGLAIVKQNGKMGVINRLGEKVIACRYDFINSINEDGIACVSLDNKIGYVDTNDRTIIPCELMTSLGENDEEYQMSLDYIKNYYGKKAEGIKSQAAKDRLLREFNQEMKKMADARVAFYAYQTKQKQKQYRTEQLRQDCFDTISSTKQELELPEYVAEEVMAESQPDNAVAEEQEIPPFMPSEAVSDGSEIEDIVATIPADEIVNND